MSELSDALKAINITKENLIDEGKLEEKRYPAFIVRRILSYFPDTVMWANHMNIYHGLPNRVQFDFLLKGVRKRKRFSKMHKAEKPENIELIKQRYGYSNQKAREALKVLSDEEIESIRASMETGGRAK